jgi:hypothetical protein
MDTRNVDFVAQIPDDVYLTDLDAFANGFRHLPVRLVRA